MSIEKIDFSYITQEKKTFTTHLNSVLQNLRNPTALGIWAYLSSLPEGWIVNREHLRKHFHLGKDKLNTVLKYLEENGLIEAGQERLEDGKMGKSYIIVKCGYDFNQDSHSYPQKTPHPQKPHPVKTASGKSAPINKIKDINKEKRERALSGDFLPNEANIILCRDLKLDVKEEMESFKNRHKGEKNQYEFGRWLKNSKEYKDGKNLIGKNNKYTNNEIRSTVKEWGPGHPSWESLHGNGAIKYGSSQGSENTRSDIRGNGVRKVESYLF